MRHNQTDNESRFTAVLRETHPHVRAYVAGLGIPLADVDDIAQEAYIAYYRKIASLPEDLLPIRWLKRTARNRAMDYFRRAARAAARRQALAELMDPDENQAPAPVADERSLRALRECLERLTARNRMLVSLRYEETSYERRSGGPHGHDGGCNPDRTSADTPEFCGTACPSTPEGRSMKILPCSIPGRPRFAQRRKNWRSGRPCCGGILIRRGICATFWRSTIAFRACSIRIVCASRSRLRNGSGSLGETVCRGADSFERNVLNRTARIRQQPHLPCTRALVGWPPRPHCLSLGGTLWSIRYPSPTATGSIGWSGRIHFIGAARSKPMRKPITMRLGGYAAIRVAPGSRVSIEGGKKAEAIFLEHGSVVCAVDRGKGTFVVRTTAGAVHVTGTRFSVRLEAPAGEQTRSIGRRRERNAEQEIGTTMAVAVMAGSVMVQAADQAIPVDEGRQIKVHFEGEQARVTRGMTAEDMLRDARD